MWLLIFVLGFIFLIWLYPQRDLKVRNYKLLAGKNTRFLIISDFHNNGLLPFDGLERILRAEKLSAIFLLGDLIDRKGGYKNTSRLLKLIASTELPVYYVHGNHEQGSRETQRLVEDLDKLGAVFLEDKVVEIGGLSVTGIGFGSIASREADVYLVHNPMDGIRSQCSGLYLAGHTHGGMVRFPIVGTFYVPGQKYLPDYHKGLYEIETDKKVLITSGLGNTFLPIRFLNPIEVIIVD